MYFVLGDKDVIVKEDALNEDVLMWHPASIEDRVSQSYVVYMPNMPAAVLDVLCADINPVVFYAVIRWLADALKDSNNLHMAPLTLRHVLVSCNAKSTYKCAVGDAYIECMYEQAKVLERVGTLNN